MRLSVLLTLSILSSLFIKNTAASEIDLVGKSVAAKAILNHQLCMKHDRTNCGRGERTPVLTYLYFSKSGKIFLYIDDTEGQIIKLGQPFPFFQAEFTFTLDEDSIIRDVRYEDGAHWRDFINFRKDGSCFHSHKELQVGRDINAVSVAHFYTVNKCSVHEGNLFKSGNYFTRNPYFTDAEWAK